MTAVLKSLRRNPLYRWHQSQGAQFEGQMVVNYTETQTPAGMGITDLGGLARIGFKGADTEQWLSAAGIDIPLSANTATLHDGLLTSRLSSTEFLIASINGHGAEEIELLRKTSSLDAKERCYLLERADSHTCFAITGLGCAEMMAKICGVDLRPHKFEPLQLAQTSVARNDAIVIRIDGSIHEPQFLIMADLSAAKFLWECLLDAMQEFEGQSLSFPAYLERIE